MSQFNEMRSALIQELCDAGELINRGEDIYEDMGGHIVHESNLDGYIEGYLKSLESSELMELMKRLGGAE